MCLAVYSATWPSMPRRALATQSGAAHSIQQLQHSGYNLVAKHVFFWRSCKALHHGPTDLCGDHFTCFAVLCLHGSRQLTKPS